MKLPCIDCITYPMCRTEYMKFITSTVASNYLPEDLMVARKFLTNKCSFLEDWIINIQTYGESYNALHAHFYLDPPV